MEVIQRMNKKLDLGWKLTNSNCQKCNGVTLADPSNLTQYYCPKCDKIFDFTQEQEEAIQNQNPPNPTYQQRQEDEDYFNEVIASSGVFSKKEPTPQAPSKIQQKQNLNQYPYQRKQQRSNEVSKKIGDKLLHGWTMLQQSCQDCNVPLMKSKKGQKICFGCDKDYASNQNNDKKKPVSNISQQPQIVSKALVQPIKQNLQSNFNQTNLSVQKEANISRKQGLGSDTLIESIECKALRFLEFKMDKAIDENDIGAVQRLLSIIQTLKK